MKKYFVLALIGLSFALFSCKDDDENIVPDEIPVELVIRNDVDAANIVKGILKTQSPGSGLSFIAETVSDATISFEGDETAAGPLVSRFDIQANNSYVAGQWDKHYVAIAQANELIEQLSNIESGAAADGFILTVAGKNTALGGAYFARALSYFYLVRLYGEAPIYTKVGETNGYPASVDNIYKQVEADLLLAEELLPTSTGVKTVPSKYAAEAILARAYLTWAQYSPEGDLSAPPADKAKLAKAVTYADKVINSKQFILLEDYSKNWGRHNKNGQEHIYNQSYVLGDARPGDGGNHQSHCAFSYGFDVDPNTQPTHIGPASYTLYTNWDGGHAGNKLDQRRDLSYTAYLAKPNSAAEFSLDHDSIYAFIPPRWIPLFGKGIDRSFYEGPLVGPTERDLDRIEIRYSEILLIKAEALIESNLNLTEAKALINQVRQRAYNQASNPSVYDITATSQTDLRTAVQQEYFNEFVYEQKRWFDLVRWHRFVRTVQSIENFPEYKGEYGTEPGSFFLKAQTHLKARYNAVTGSGTKYYTFPIPETAIAANPNLK
ncbi:RagB/SusD family nutrient uptake outer membrane protein [termite gut metagenome]|uniref:RagB/SusD family nutrient uptake outer membrane protein n=1 Tax=termite gut metagenome TaxID=433724 RepID=A0A5J4SEZ6_9ZZZZ